MSAAKEKTETSEAPFRKELKSDKLKIALKYGSVFIPAVRAPAMRTRWRLHRSGS